MVRDKEAELLLLLYLVAIYQKISINKSLKKALKFKIKKSLNPFEIKNINASSEILKFLKRYNFKKLRLEKRFYDH